MIAQAPSWSPDCQSPKPDTKEIPLCQGFAGCFQGVLEEPLKIGLVSMFCIDFNTFYRAGLPLQGKGYQFGGLNSSDQSFVPLALFSAVEKTWSGKLVGELAPFEK